MAWSRALRHAASSLLLSGAALPHSAGAQLPDVRVNDLDNGGELTSFTQSETSIAVQAQMICIAWNDTGTADPNVSGFGGSTNGGSTFADAGEFPPASPPLERGDPTLAYSQRDALYYYAALGDLARLHLWRSSTCTSAGVGTFTYRGQIHAQTPTVLNDREMLAIDNSSSSPYYGRAYIAFYDPYVPREIQIGWSDSPDVESDADGWPTERFQPLPGTGPSPQAPWIATAPSGEVYVAIAERAENKGGTMSYRLYESTNGGGFWLLKPLPIGSGRRPERESASDSCFREALNGNIRVGPGPQIAIHEVPGSPGYVIHAVYPYDSDGAPPTGGDESNVFYRRSTDGGQNWSNEFRLNWDDSTLTDQWQPSIAVSEQGVVAVTWYDRRLDPASNLRFVRAVTLSTDGGLTWERNAQLSDAISDVTPTGGYAEDGITPLPKSDPRGGNCYHGDYDQIVASGSEFHVVWSDDRELRETSCGSFPNCPNPDVYYDRVFDLDTPQPPDQVYQSWDICTTYSNPRPGALQPWMTLMSRQRDGDADGFGNRCDPDFTNGVMNGSVAGNLYLHLGQYAWMNREMFASIGKPIATSTCGRQGNLPCDIFDKNEDDVVGSCQ